MNQQKKNKVTINNRGNNFCAQNLESCLFYIFEIFVRAKSFRKKINRLEIVLITSFYYTTYKTLSTLAVSSNKSFFGISLKACNLSFCLLSNTSSISSIMATSSFSRLQISSSSSNAVKISLISSPKLLPVSSTIFSFSLQLSFSTKFFPVLLSLT